jgi:hypothetical protein
MFNGPNTVTDGLVFWLDAANNKSYISGSLVWNNLTKGISSCSFSSNASLRPGYSSANGGEIMFNTTSSANTNLGPGTNYPYPYHTFEIWVRSSGLGPGMTIAGLFGMDYGRNIYIGSNSIQYIWATGSAAFINANATPLNSNLFDNNYHQIVCLRKTSSFEMYIDGVLRTSGAPGNTGLGWDGLNVWSSLTAQLGNNPNDGVYRLSGSIAIAKIYNRGLTQDEVIQNYNATKGRLGR